MKIGIIAPGNIWFSPYLNIYTKILKECEIKYEIVFWDRDGSEKGKGISFETKIDNSQSRLSKLSRFISYSNFVKRTITEKQYEKLIILGPQLGILLAPYLKRKYRKRYIFDFRDLSIEQYAFLQPRFKKLLSNSALNVISSPGFKQYLPKGFQYIISHNFDIDLCKSALLVDDYQPLPDNPISVLTIGGIRDYSSNSAVICNLANRDNIKMSFVGKGTCADLLKKYGEEHDCHNITFEGYYPKEKEKEYIASCTFINIFYPNIKSHSSALSNRFYNALVYKRPMIVTSNSIQGDYVEQNNLGLSLETCEKLDEKMRLWMKNNDYQEFVRRCNVLLSEYVKEQNYFIDCVKDFVNSDDHA